MKKILVTIHSIHELYNILPSDPQFIAVFNFIENNYEKPITLKDVATAVNYCPTYLTNLVGQKTGHTVQAWIIKRRMAAACSLLLETDEKVENIASKVGYKNVVHFFRQFRQYHGMSPLIWKMEAQLAQPEIRQNKL